VIGIIARSAHKTDEAYTSQGTAVVGIFLVLAVSTAWNRLHREIDLRLPLRPDLAR